LQAEFDNFKAVHLARSIPAGASSFWPLFSLFIGSATIGANVGPICQAAWTDVEDGASDHQLLCVSFPLSASQPLARYFLHFN
jgi:hypothetical protein